MLLLITATYVHHRFFFINLSPKLNKILIWNYCCMMTETVILLLYLYLFIWIIPFGNMNQIWAILVINRGLVLISFSWPIFWLISQPNLKYIAFTYSRILVRPVNQLVSTGSSTRLAGTFRPSLTLIQENTIIFFLNY